MPYTLMTSDGQHTVLGVSNGNRINEPDDSFWITGWPPQTQQAVAVGGFYILRFPDGHNNSVEVDEIGGAGQGGIRFSFTG